MLEKREILSQTCGLPENSIDYVMLFNILHHDSPLEFINEAYRIFNPKGKIVIAGSSSVTPIMEKLKEAYIGMNPNAVIEIQMSDSTAGMTGVMDGTCDIGMASRELKKSESDKLKNMAIALDGIAVIVNNKNSINGLTKDQVKDIFTGKISDWGQLKK